MRKLTFDAIMEFYKPHNRNMFQKIVAAQRNGPLSPFVGAGLSVPFGYKQWGGVLTELAENIMDDTKKAFVLDQIKKGKYEEAAGTILEEYPYMLDQLPDIVSPDILARCPDEKKRTSAAWVLPYLFRKGFVMTTNFDRVLEQMYLTNQNEVIPVVTPLEQDRLAQLRQNQALSLFKLHGDIGSEAISLEDLVFTGEQYDKHYAKGSPLTEELARCFANRRLLFLGCSLNVDRTMQVLQQVALSQKGIRHFAILGCKKSEISARMKELQALGILPIFYDDSDHDAVRVILERLLEETERDAYQRLVRSSWVAPPSPREERSLMFDAEYFPFSGREQEMARLEEFTAAEERFLWWSVTGPGGMGKSRLVYEFCKKKRKDGWCTERFEAHPSRDSNARSLEELTGWKPSVEKTIVVLDDVQAHMDTVCRWITALARCPRSEELRILLLERDGKTPDDASWLSNDPRCEDLEQWCHDETFLRLEPMTDDQLLEIMNGYAAAAGKTINAALLLKTLERVDPELKRPLYAIALADTRCQGKDPTNWDRSKILDALLDRELEFHFSRLQSLGSLSKTLKTELACLLAGTCITGFLPLDAVDWNKYEKLRKRMDAAEMDPEEFFDRLGILRTVQVDMQEVDQHGNPVEGTVQEKVMKVITLTCPDLIKEHLVLNLAFEKQKLELLPDGWEQDPDRLLFLHRLWTDYPERLKDQRGFWDRFFGGKPPAGLPAWLYANLLWGCTDLFQSFAEQAVDSLAGLYDMYSEDEMIAVCYAKGLYNLSCDQPPKEQVHTLGCLEKLYQTNPDSQIVAISLARCLSNLSCSQSIEEMSCTVDRLERMCQKHSDYQQVAECYASALVGVALFQKTESEVRDTLARSKTVLKKYPDHTDIQICHAMTWFNLTLVQKDADIPATVSDIAAFLRAHPDAITGFEEALDEYLSKHPDHKARYQPLLELGGDDHG